MVSCAAAWLAKTAASAATPNIISLRNMGFLRIWACLGVRLALRIDDLLELAQNAHAGEELGEAAVRLALLLDRRDELAVLQLDAVHRDVDLGDVDLGVLAVGEVVVERLEGAVIADVAEEAAERAVVVERQREREDCAGRHLADDPHVHGDLQL